MPLEELRGLLNKEEAVKAPVEFVYESTGVDVRVEGKSARVTATMKLSVLAETWVQVPVGLSAGVVEVTVDEKPASLVQKGGVMFVLLNWEDGQGGDDQRGQ